MKKQKFYLVVLLFILGFIGILTQLTIDLPMSEALLEKYTVMQIKLLSLLNPLFLLVIALLLGVFFKDKVGLKVPIIEAVVKREPEKGGKSLLIYGFVGGVISGAIFLIIRYFYIQTVPNELYKYESLVVPSFIARLLFGGLTEEILLRFGFMTFFIWLFSKIFNSLNPKVYWLGILIAALLFAFGHFPGIYSALGNPSTLFLTYPIIANSIFGIIFGWLYWKKGLESAFIAHATLHVVFLLKDLF